VQKRDLLCGTLREAGLAPSVPNGAYYVLSDASILPGKTSRDKAMYLLRETGVASVAGSAFYHDQGGENLIRFCFAKTDAELAEACARLRGLREKLVSEIPSVAREPYR
jgi:aminotransferase